MVAWFKVGGVGFRVPESCQISLFLLISPLNKTGSIAGNIIVSYLFLFPLIPVV